MRRSVSGYRPYVDSANWCTRMQKLSLDARLAVEFAVPGIAEPLNGDVPGSAERRVSSTRMSSTRMPESADLLVPMPPPSLTDSAPPEPPPSRPSGGFLSSPAPAPRPRSQSSLSRASASRSTDRPSSHADYDEVIAYLLSLGATLDDVSKCPAVFPALQNLAMQHGGDLKHVADVKAAGAMASRIKKQRALAERRKALKPLTEKQRRRLRLTFDHFDADFSGKLDMEEFRRAMIDSGMMPLGYEVKELFEEADEDGSQVTIGLSKHCRTRQWAAPADKQTPPLLTACRTSTLASFAISCSCIRPTRARVRS